MDRGQHSRQDEICGENRLRKQTSFLDLPRELRDMVYEAYFEGTTATIVLDKHGEPDPEVPELCFAHHQLRDETCAFIYRKNKRLHFHIRDLNIRELLSNASIFNQWEQRLAFNFPETNAFITVRAKTVRVKVDETRYKFDWTDQALENLTWWFERLWYNGYPMFFRHFSFVVAFPSAHPKDKPEKLFLRYNYLTLMKIFDAFKIIKMLCDLDFETWKCFPLAHFDIDSQSKDEAEQKDTILANQNKADIEKVLVERMLSCFMRFMQADRVGGVFTPLYDMGCEAKRMAREVPGRGFREMEKTREIRPRPTMFW